MPGRRFHLLPIPPIEEHLTRVPAGPLTLGVEYRVFNDETAWAWFGREDEDPAVVEAVKAQEAELGGFDDEGVSVHVFETSTGHEILRFDCFRNDPHYHYISNDAPYVDMIHFDPVVSGDMLAWTLEQLDRHTPAMLREAGKTELAEQVDERLLADALVTVRELATRGRHPAAAG